MKSIIFIGILFLFMSCGEECIECTLPHPTLQNVETVQTVCDNEDGNITTTIVFSAEPMPSVSTELGTLEEKRINLEALGYTCSK